MMMVAVVVLGMSPVRPRHHTFERQWWSDGCMASQIEKTVHGTRSALVLLAGDWYTEM